MTAPRTAARIEPGGDIYEAILRPIDLPEFYWKAPELLAGIEKIEAADQSAALDVSRLLEVLHAMGPWSFTTSLVLHGEEIAERYAALTPPATPEAE